MLGWPSDPCVISFFLILRPNHSTLLAIIDMVDKITYAIDNKLYSVGVFVDLSKAFDTFDHKIL